MKFTGQILDNGVDLYYYGARYYDANIGRFISADTIVSSLRNPQTLNRYSYALNNPLRYIDPTGHQAGDVPDWALVQDPNTGTVSWAKDNDIQAAQQAGATIISPSQAGPGNYPQWSAPAQSSANENEGTGNQVVSSSAQNPDAIIDNGTSTAPALPGATMVGVGNVGSGSNVSINSWIDTSISSATTVPQNATLTGSKGAVGNVKTGEFVVGWLLVEVGSVWSMAGIFALPVPPAAAVLEIIAAIHYGAGVYFIAKSVQ